MQKKIIIIIILATCIMTSLQSQSFFINDIAYERSETGYLEGDFNQDHQSIGVFFVHQGEINHIVFETYFWAYPIKVIGNVKIYLDDNSVINLIDRYQTDCVGNTCYSMYNLTSDEIKKLIASNISMMRFKTSGGSQFEKTDNLVYNESNKPYGGGPYTESKAREGKTPSDFSKIVSEYFSNK